MTTNERFDEIQSQLNNIETRFNNMDARFNNLDSHLNDIENRLTNSQLNNPDAITQLGQQPDRIKDERRRPDITDIQMAWLTLMSVGAGWVGGGLIAGAVKMDNLSFAALLVFAGLIIMIIGYCGAKRLWWFKRRCE
jgi:uncharacterized protein YdcH (DUF465 family)